MSKRRYNVLYSHKNIVLFDKYNKSSLVEKRFVQHQNISLINLSSYDKNYIKSNLNKINSSRDIDFLYVGRINQTQKMLNLLIVFFHMEIKNYLWSVMVKKICWIIKRK